MGGGGAQTCHCPHIKKVGVDAPSGLIESLFGGGQTFIWGGGATGQHRNRGCTIKSQMGGGAAMPPIITPLHAPLLTVSYASYTYVSVYCVRQLYICICVYIGYRVTKIQQRAVCHSTVTVLRERSHFI